MALGYGLKLDKISYIFIIIFFNKYIIRDKNFVYDQLG